MADGSTKLARDVEVGDQLAVAGACSGAQAGAQTTVEARTVQASPSSPRLMAKLPGAGVNLTISRPHRIQHDGVWLKPEHVPGAVLVESNVVLYNFIVTGRRAIEVEGLVVSTIGQYCRGSHDMISKPTHRLWATEHVVDLFKMHPSWPNIRLQGDDGFLSLIKTPVWAHEYLATIPNGSPGGSDTTARRKLAAVLRPAATGARAVQATPAAEGELHQSGWGRAGG